MYSPTVTKVIEPDHNYTVNWQYASYETMKTPGPGVIANVAGDDIYLATWLRDMRLKEYGATPPWWEQYIQIYDQYLYSPTSRRNDAVETSGERR